MIVRDAALIEGGITPAFLIACLDEYKAQVERMNTLAEAYASKPNITTRTVQNGFPNNKLVHNYGRYIVAITSGYLVGNPITYKSEDDIDELLDIYKKSRIGSVDAELAKDAALYGKGVELCYVDSEVQARTAALDPREAFVVYGNDIAATPLLGVRQYTVVGVDGRPAGVVVVVYTDKSILTYRGQNIRTACSASPEEEPHYFGGVPMIEYWNNDDETGDFEHVLSLIDAYDKLQSDRVNDKEQFVQSILLMTGARMEKEPDELDEDGSIKRRGRSAAQQIREDKMIFLPDTDAHASYLTKSMAEADVEILKDAIKSDIHKFSMVPDLSDENFAGNVSGVAMRYKLFGLEQLTKVKENWFREGLLERLKLFTTFLTVKGQKSIDVNKVEIIFKRALPANEMELAQIVSMLNGTVPQETLLALLPFVEDPAAMAEQIAKEKQEAAKQQQAAFGMPLAERGDA